MNRLLPLALVVGASLLGGCGSSDVCSRSKSCSADPDFTESQRAECRNNLASYSADCRSKIEALANCAADNAKCGSDNKTDPIATGAAVAEKCASQIQAAQGCTPQGDGGSSGDGG